MFRTTAILRKTLYILLIMGTAFLVHAYGKRPAAKESKVEVKLEGNKGGGDRFTGAPFAGRSVVMGKSGMASTSQPLASLIAVDILKKGGNAVDAAIAANAALGLMEPTGCGIGGDIFVILWDPKTEKLYGLNGSGRAPLNQTMEDLKAKIGGDASEMPNWGSLSVTVPGTVDGWFELHGRFGSLPMKQLLKPTIDYARKGFPVTQVIAYYMEVQKNHYRNLYEAGNLEEIDNFRKTYLIDELTPVEGEVFKNPDLANTLEKIAKRGRDIFYRGELADRMAAYMRGIGGPLMKRDFENHSSTWIDPVSINYRGYDIYELPPNSQGIAALQMLNILEGFDLAAMGLNSADYLHVQIEAKKLVYEDRARFYADPDFYAANIDYLLSKEYADERRALIDPKRAMMEVDHGDPELIEGDTIYMTVADKEGMMVSLIQSNYRGMGSGLVPEGLGFIFQNRGALFSLDPNHPNAYAPGKRPFHTIIPAFVLKDGKPVLSFGVVGGAMQPQGHAQIVANLVDFHLNPQEAGDVARYRHHGSKEPYIVGKEMTTGGVVHVETGIYPDVVTELRRRGHVVEVSVGSFGGYQAIWRDSTTGVYSGASEMRTDGASIGF